MSVLRPVFVVEVRGTTLIVTPQEDLMEFQFDQDEVAAESVLKELESGTIKNLIVDFCKCACVGSRALGFFVKLWHRVRHGGGKLTCCNVSVHIREVLKIMHLDQHWPICGTLEDALAVVEK